MAALTRIRNNQVYNSDIDASTKIVPGSITGALWQQNLTYSGNLTIGNLTVNGTTTTLDTTNLLVADPLLAINRNQSGTPSYDLGLIMGRGNQTNVAFIWEEAAKQFQLMYTTESTSATTFGTINNSGFANLQAYGILLNNATIGTLTVTTPLNLSSSIITGGYINNVIIGNTTPNSATFTSVTTSSGGQFIGYHTGAIGANGGNTGAFTTVTASNFGNAGATYSGASLTLTGNISVNAVSAGQIGNTNTRIEGVIATESASQPNITSLGTLTTLTVSGTTNLQGTTNGATINATNLYATTIGNTGAAINGNLGNFATVYAGTIGNTGASLVGTIATAAQTNITSLGTLSALTVSGTTNLQGTTNGATINATNLYATTIGNTGAAINGNLGNFSAVYAGTIGNTGASLVGTISTAAQTNITSLGTLSALTVSGTTNLQGTTNGATINATNLYATTIGNTGAAINGNLANFATVYAGTIGNTNTNHYGATMILTGGMALNTNASIVTDQTTASVFNAGVTTLNLGQAATTINMGLNGASSVKVAGTANSYGSGQGALQITGGFYAGGDSYIAGNLVVANLTSLGYTALSVNSPMVYLDATGISNYNYEIGFYSHKYDAIEGYNHTGFIRNHTDNAWYLFSNIRTEPTNTVDLGNAYIVYDTLKIGNLNVLQYNADATGINNGVGSITTTGGLSVSRTIYAGSIQNTPIGNGTASTGAFTTLTTTSTFTSQGTISAPTINAGTIGNAGATFAGTSMTLTGNISVNAVSAGQIGNTNTRLEGVIAAESGSQPNITAIGTLTSLTINGNLSVNAINAGQLGNTNTILEGTISSVSASQPNVTSLGTLTTLTVSGTTNLQGTTNGATVNATNLYATTIGNTGAAINGNLANFAAVYAGTIGNTGAAHVGSTLTLSGVASIGGNLVVSSATAAPIGINNTTIGALVIPTGGAAIGGNINVGTNMFVNSVAYVGTGSNGSTLTNPTIIAKGAGSTYTQVALINGTSTGSSDFIAYGDNYPGPSNDHGWADVGFTGSAFSDPNYTITKSNDAYLFGSAVSGSGGGNLVIATDNTGSYNDIVIAASGFYSNAEVARFHGNVSTSGNLSIKYTTASTSSTSGALQVTGGVGVGGNIYSGANIVATTATVAPSAYHSSINPSSGTDVNINPNANGNFVVNAGGVVANVIIQGNTTSGGTYGNLLTTNGYTGQVGIKVAPNAMIANASLIVNSTDSILVPVGSTAQRPSSNTAGMIRYNNQTSQMEFANGSAWTSFTGAYTTISEDTFTGTGSQTAFTLSQSTTTNAVIVSINGIVQIPITAYSVTGNTLTFTEAPLVTDIIDARTIASTSIVTGLSIGTSSVSLTDTGAGTGNVSVNVNNTYRYIANTATGGSNYFRGGLAPMMNPIALTQGANTIVDSFTASTFTSAKYIIKMVATSGALQTSELLVVANSTTSNYTITSNVYIGTGVATVGANVSAGTVYIVASASASGSTATVMPIYMPI